MIERDWDEIVADADDLRDSEQVDSHFDRELAAADRAWDARGEEYQESLVVRRAEASASTPTGAAQSDALPRRED